MGIATQIFQDLFGIGKGTLSIDNPVFVFSLVKELAETLRSTEGRAVFPGKINSPLSYASFSRLK